MPTARKRRTESASRTPRATRSTARNAVVAALGLSPRLGARTEYRIYPSIGIARVGDCKDSFIIGPEAPGVVPSGPFRGADHGLKPQAARFRVYKVDIDANENETVTEELVPRDDIKIEWSVSLANRKAAGLRIRRHSSSCGQSQASQCRARSRQTCYCGNRFHHRLWDRGPGTFGRHRVCEAKSKRSEGNEYSACHPSNR